MGMATYYLKARWPSEEAATAAYPLVESFLEEAGRAGDWWQNHRGQKPQDFWPEFKEQFPLVHEYLSAPIFERSEYVGNKYVRQENVGIADGPDCNNALAGQLSFGGEEGNLNLVEHDAEIHYNEYTWHLATWDPLCEWLKRKFGAVKAEYVSDEYADVADTIDLDDPIPEDAILLDSNALTKLQAIKTRLYDDKPLTPDQRRDLANAMDAVLHPIQKLVGQEQRG